MTSAKYFSWTFSSSQIITKNVRSNVTALSLVWFLRDVEEKEPPPLFEKSFCLQKKIGIAVPV